MVDTTGKIPFGAQFQQGLFCQRRVNDIHLQVIPIVDCTNVKRMLQAVGVLTLRINVEGVPQCPGRVRRLKEVPRGKFKNGLGCRIKWRLPRIGRCLTWAGL